MGFAVVFLFCYLLFSLSPRQEDGYPERTRLTKVHFLDQKRLTAARKSLQKENIMFISKIKRSRYGF